MQRRLLLHRLADRHEPRVRVPLSPRPPADLFVVHPVGDDRSPSVDEPRVRVATRGDEEREVQEQDDEAQGGADGDDGAFAVDGVVVGFLGRAAGEAFAEVGRGGGGVAYGAVWEDEVGGAVVVAFGDGASLVVVVVVVGVPPEIIPGAHRCECACDYQSEPQQQIACYVRAGVDRSVADEEHEDVGDVPDYGEAEADKLPREEPDVAVVGPVVVGVVVIVVDVVWEDDLVG